MLIPDIKREHRIVVFRALKLGDMLCSLPALKLLRESYPESHISIICHPAMTGLFARYTHFVDEAIPFPGFPGMPEKEYSPLEVISFISKMQERQFDMAIQLHGSGQVSNILLNLIDAKTNYGFYSLDSLGHNEMTFIPYPEKFHESRRCHRLISFITGNQNEMPEVEFPIFEEDIAELHHLINVPAEPFICLHPGASTLTKRWPAENFKLLADYIRSKGFQVVFTGSSTESELVTFIRSKMNRDSIDSASCDLSLGALAQLIKLSSGIVCNDTGVSHLAALLKKRSIVLFSETDPVRWGPLNTQIHLSLMKPSLEEVIKHFDSIQVEQMEAP